MKSTHNLIKVLLCLGALVISPELFAKPQYGAGFSFSYFPGSLSFGGEMPVYEESDSEVGDAGTAQTLVEDGSELNSLSRWDVGASFFYDYLMARLSYTSIHGGSYLVDHDSFDTDDAFSVDTGFFNFVGGVRFSPLGDTSYSFLYLGYRRMDLSSSYMGVSLWGNGTIIGVENFYSFPLVNQVEWVVYGDAHVGNYFWTGMETETSGDVKEKTKSLSIGGTAGVGLQYLPLNITAMAVFACDVDQISQSVELSDGSADYGVRHGGLYYGFSVSYQYLNFKYNN